jgi:protein-tyrosine-phosphatase
MAAGLMRHFYGHKVYVRSAGVRPGKIDPMVTEVMDEIGIDITKHKPKGFDDLEDSSFDVVVSLSPEAHHRALEMTRTMAVEAEYWPTMDPSAVEGNREQMLDAYRAVRDVLMKKIRGRFGEVSARGV